VTIAGVADYQNYIGLLEKKFLYLSDILRIVKSRKLQREKPTRKTKKDEDFIKMGLREVGSENGRWM